jgi:hypothetical protein
MGALVEHDHSFYGKKWEDMNDKEQEAVKDYEEAMYGGNMEPLESGSSGLEDTVNND